MQCPMNSCKSRSKCLSRQWLFIIFLIIAIVIGVFHLNNPLFFAINNQHGLLPDNVWLVVNYIAYTKHFILMPLLLLIILLFKRDYFFRVLCLVFAFYVVFWGLKHLIGEARPYMVIPMGSLFWLNKYEEAVKSAYFSFPSGHTGQTAIFVFALMKLFFQKNPFIKFVLFLILLFVGVARICTGWHWPLDVITSGLIAYILVQIFLCKKDSCETAN